MEKSKIEMFLMMNGKNLPTEKLPIVKETLEKIAILYGFYLEENKGNEEKNIFGREMTRALKGNR